MAAVTFGVLSAVACGFLTYVLAHFRREPANARKTGRHDSEPAQVPLVRVERALRSARASRYVNREQQTRAEAVLRRETLISGIVGLFGLLALFVLVMLLNSGSIWHP
jgi:hypothetical protein